jgi:hypothetical protein
MKKKDLEKGLRAAHAECDARGREIAELKLALSDARQTHANQMQELRQQLEDCKVTVSCLRSAALVEWNSTEHIARVEAVIRGIHSMGPAVALVLDALAKGRKK